MSVGVREVQREPAEQGYGERRGGADGFVDVTLVAADIGSTRDTLAASDASRFRLPIVRAHRACSYAVVRVYERVADAPVVSTTPKFCPASKVSENPCSRASDTTARANA